MGSILFYKIFSYSGKPKYNTTKMIVLATAIFYVTKIVGPLVWTKIDMNLNLPEEDFMKIVYIAILNLITGSMKVFLLKLCLSKNLIVGKTQISSVTFLFSFVLVMEYFLTKKGFSLHNTKR